VTAGRSSTGSRVALALALAAACLKGYGLIQHALARSPIRHSYHWGEALPLDDQWVKEAYRPRRDAWLAARQAFLPARARHVRERARRVLRAGGVSRR
jgi:hypothetical protein